MSLVVVNPTLARMVVKPFLHLTRRVSTLSSRNPTKRWKKNSSRDLVVDLDEATLCGVGLGEPVENLAFLGPCEGFSHGSMDATCVDSDSMIFTYKYNIDTRPHYFLTLDYDSIGISVTSNRE